MDSKKCMGKGTRVKGSGHLCSGGTAAGLSRTADAVRFKLGGKYVVSYVLDSHLQHCTSFIPLFRLIDTGRATMQRRATSAPSGTLLGPHVPVDWRPWEKGEELTDRCSGPGNILVVNLDSVLLLCLLTFTDVA